jgi:hypothetical protein
VRAWEILAAVALVAVVYVLVRPGSAGPEFVAAVGGALTAVVGQVTDLAGDRGRQIQI